MQAVIYAVVLVVVTVLATTVLFSPIEGMGTVAALMLGLGVAIFATVITHMFWMAYTGGGH
jgi:hypothetical protein